MISIKNVNKKFGKLNALKDIDVDLHMGRSYALVGPNGSGKTTLFKSILGLVIPSSGEIYFNKKSIAKDWKYREHIGYMPQTGRYPENMTIGQVIDMMKNIRTHSAELDDSLIKSFKLYEMLDKRIHALSGGTRQKVSAALAFLFNPPVLIFDEPTAGLDPLSVETLKEKIVKEKSKGKLLIISSHILSDLDELATDIIYIYEGKVHYNNSIRVLKEETQENRLGKAVATMIEQKELLDSINK